MCAYLKKDVEIAVRKLFPDRKKEEIMNVLNKYKSDSYRVHLAILKLSQGNYEQLVDFTNKAIIDFRDVLWWAEYEGKGSKKKIDSPYKGILN